MHRRVSGTKFGLVTSVYTHTHTHTHICVYIYIYIYFNLGEMIDFTLVLILRFIILVCVFWVLQLCLEVSNQFKGEK